MARGHVRRTSKTNGIATGPGVTLYGLDDLITRLTTVEKKLQNPKKALDTIVKEFAFMEEERFRNSGVAQEFGIYQPWQPIAESTWNWRKSVGGNQDTRPLVALGFLQMAATMPVVTPFGKKSVSLSIDPRRFNKDEQYTHGNNYGNFHQIGEGNNPKREFVTLTPAFSQIAKKIILAYLNDEISGNGYRNYRSIGTPGGRGRHAKPQKPAPFIKRGSRAQDPEITRINRSAGSRRAASTRIANQRAERERLTAEIADRRAANSAAGWHVDEMGNRTIRKTYGEYLHNAGHRRLSPSDYMQEHRRAGEAVSQLQELRRTGKLTESTRNAVLKNKQVTPESIKFHQANYAKYAQGGDGFATP